jgi:hypothetical protein
MYVCIYLFIILFIASNIFWYLNGQIQGKPNDVNEENYLAFYIIFVLMCHLSESVRLKQCRI